MNLVPKCEKPVVKESERSNFELRKFSMMSSEQATLTNSALTNG